MTESLATPDVTVVVVTFDRLELLPRALESIAQQTFPAERMEVVVVNDAGQDPSSVLESFEDRLAIRLINHEHNKGIAGAINSGITAAAGRYICLLADDDRYYPRHVQALFERAEELGGNVITYSDAIKVVEDENGHDISRLMYEAPARFSRDQLLVQNYIPGHCLMVPSVVFETVGLFDESFEALEDWDMWIRATAQFAMARVLEVTAEYRWRAQSRNNNTTRERPRHFTNLEQLYAKHPVDKRLEAARAANLQASRPLLTEHAFELSVLIASEGSVEDLQRSLESIVMTFGEEGSYEVVIHAPRESPAAQLMDSLEGDVMMIYGDVPTPQAWEILERKAAGRRLVRLPAGDVLSADAVAAAMR